MVGFGCSELNPFGPLQLYDTPPLANRFNAPPVQTGVLLDALAAGAAFTVTSVVVVAVHPAAVVIVTV